MAYRMTLLLPAGARGIKRKFADARKKALHEVGEKWSAEILPLHFRADASTRYRYQKRTPAYLKRKRRENKGEDPNVYTGQMRDKMTAARPSYRVNRNGITLTWRGLPRHTFITSTYEFVANDRRWDDAFLESLKKTGNYKAVEGIMKWRRDNPQGAGGRVKLIKRPDKPAELTTVNREDANRMAKWARETIARVMRELKGRG